MFFYLFLFKYRFAKNRIPYPKAIFILRFLLNKREGKVLANKFFGVNLSAETDYKFYIILFQTTKIQTFSKQLTTNRSLGAVCSNAWSLRKPEQL